jgi:hypothetical protein
MTRDEQNEKALRGASRNAQTAFDAACSEEFASIPQDEKIAWAMAAIIHCDICRVVVAFDECEREGIARLLWMADIVSKLHEAKRWYFEKGGPLLRRIGGTKGYGADYIGKKIKKIRDRHPIGEVEAFGKYRNKLGYHYDANAIDYLKEFGNEDAEAFHGLLLAFSRHSGEWAQITRSLIRDELPNEALKSDASR